MKSSNKLPSYTKLKDLEFEKWYTFSENNQVLLEFYLEEWEMKEVEILRKKFICGLAILISFVLGYIALKILLNNRNTEVVTLKNIAYDVQKKYGYTVYLKENADYVPYLVLTADYNGNVLLLRRDVLDDDLIYNDESKNFSSYYEDSYVDRFLNNEFINSLDVKIKKSIVDSNITISSDKNLIGFGVETNDISRKVFLLSCSEIGLNSKYLIPNEGSTLKYFDKKGRRIVYKNGEPWAWWLRTPYIGAGSYTMVWIIYQNEMADANSINGFFPECGVRPAFCLNGDTNIVESLDILDGEKVFIITD